MSQDCKTSCPVKAVIGQIFRNMEYLLLSQFFRTEIPQLLKLLGSFMDVLFMERKFDQNNKFFSLWVLFFWIGSSVKLKMLAHKPLKFRWMRSSIYTTKNKDKISPFLSIQVLPSVHPLLPPSLRSLSFISWVFQLALTLHLPSVILMLILMLIMLNSLLLPPFFFF